MPNSVETVGFRENKHLIIGRFYGAQRETVMEAARAFDRAGWSDVYPNRKTPITEFPADDEMGAGTNVFYFLGRERQATYPAQIQADVFAQMQCLRGWEKICYVAIHQGYLGESTSVEISYGLMVGAPLVLAEEAKITFSDKVHPTTRDIIEKYLNNYPVLPVKTITSDSLEEARKLALVVTPPEMTNEEAKNTIDTAIKLIQRLSFDYPDYYLPHFRKKRQRLAI